MAIQIPTLIDTSMLGDTNNAINADTVTDFLTVLTRAAENPFLIHPNLIAGLGKKNIHTYRKLLLKKTKEARISGPVVRIVIQLTMEMKNFKKLVSGLKMLDARVIQDPVVMSAMGFLENHCQETTKDPLMKMPTVKIPESFPDICAQIFIAQFALLKAGVEITNDELDKVTKLMLSKNWVASLALDNVAQEYNKSCVKAEWDSWGLNGAKDRLGNPIRFIESNYLNQASDNISLLTMNGHSVTTASGLYSAGDIKTYIKDTLDNLRCIYAVSETSLV